MGGPGSREPRIRAFHAELAFYLFDKGRMGEILSTSTWERLIVQALGASSRQTVVDITFFMEAHDLIQRDHPMNTGKQGRPGRGIIVLPVSQELEQSLPGSAQLASPLLA